MKNNPRFSRDQVGETGSHDPSNPPEIKESLDLFFNYYAQEKLLELKFYFLNNHLNKYRDWNIIGIENELSKIRNFIKRVSSIETKNVITEKYEKEAYLHFKNEEYKKYWKEANDQNLINVYAKYFLFYDFLKNKAIQLYREGNFFKLSPNQQIDFILFAIKEHTDEGGITFIDLIKYLENIKHTSGYTLIKEILNKLIKDGKIIVQDELYILTFEGRYFSGYVVENDSLLKKTIYQENLEQRMKGNAERLNALTGGLCVVTFLVGFPLIMDYQEKHYLIYSYVLYFIEGILLGVFIHWLKSKLFANKIK